MLARGARALRGAAAPALARGADRGAGRAAAVRRRRASTRSPSPTCCAMSTIRRRRCASSRASCARAGAWRRSSSACRRGRPRVRRGACTRPSGCPRWGASPRASGARWAASWGRASAASTSAIRWSAIVGYWQQAGLEDVSVRRMSLGGGVVMSGGQAPARASSSVIGEPRASSARPSTRSEAGVWADAVTLLHPPYTAWHLSYFALGAAVAPQLYVDRLLWGLRGVRARGGRGRARARRAARPAARAPRSATARCCCCASVEPAGRAGDRRRGRADGVGVAGAVRARRRPVPARLQPRACSAGAFTATCGSRLGWGAFPAFTGLLRQRAAGGAAGAADRGRLHWR